MSVDAILRVLVCPFLCPLFVSCVVFVSLLAWVVALLFVFVVFSLGCFSCLASYLASPHSQIVYLRHRGGNARSLSHEAVVAWISNQRRLRGGNANSKDQSLLIKDIELRCSSLA